MAEVEPTLTYSSPTAQSETWDESDAEQFIRPRKVRKRKRRPQLAEEDDLVPQVITYNEDSLPHLQENIERPRRRRKKIGFQNSEDKEQSSRNEETNRPKRRRGQKRKRPSADSWIELSEFAGTHSERTDGSVDITDHRKTEIDSVYEESQKNVNDKIDSKVQIYNKKEAEIENTTKPIIDYELEPQVIAKDEDKSISEFSIESTRQIIEKPNRTRIEIQKKAREKGVMLTDNIKPSKDKEPLDPFTLKSLLKRSNGKSLSEILQQNNLSLADLLHGREKALSILKKESLARTQDISQSRHSNTEFNSPISSFEDNDTFNKKEFSESEKLEENENLEIETTTNFDTEDNAMYDYKETNNDGQESVQHNYQENDNTQIDRRGYMRRRFPGGIRRKLRTRPTEKNTYKGQLSRDLIAMTSLKYKNNRSLSKSREWKDIIPSMMKTESLNTESTIQMETETEMITATPCSYSETTTEEVHETTTETSYTSVNTEPITEFRGLLETTVDSKSTYLEIEGIDIAQFTTMSVDINTEQEQETITRKPRPVIKTTMNSSDMRRQALNNRLKRKRIKQRISTTEIPEELEVKDTFGIGKFVSASKFITQSQTRTTNAADEDDFTTLEDYLTTEAPQKVPSRRRSKKPIKSKNPTTFTIQKIYVTTEETAKYEIEEILNDNHTSEKLSKILKERNMTLKELVEHRERGSSHVHLADIFHNASREPNPPEPFLSKSLIEPISRETYPLRALLEANLHDARSTTIDPTSPQANNANIPVVMDFGNNVNENGENKGVIPLLQNFSETDTDKSNLNKESTRINYNTKDIHTNTQGIGTSREARMLNSEKDSVTWNDLINLMQKNHQKEHIDSEKPLEQDTFVSETLKKIDLEEDLDGDGVIILDDLQHLRNMEKKTSTDRLLELKIYERNNPNAANMILSDTKSVTIATVSIIGLALILFLLTYAVLRWKQQIKLFDTKRAKEDEFVPTPVFESRKGQKINSSTRSKSPMLATSNIYSIETIDTHAGSESPEYMWETLRKPFQ